MILTLGDIKNRLEGFSKDELEDLSEKIGVHINTLKNIKSGKNDNPTYQVMESLSNWLSSGVHVDNDFMGEVVEQNIGQDDLDLIGELIENVNHIKVPKSLDHIVYVLKKNGEPVYVGCSKNGLKRPFNHVGNKDFDSLSYIFVPENKMNLIESYVILLLEPKLNHRSPHNGRYILSNEVRELVDKKLGMKQ